MNEIKEIVNIMALIGVPSLFACSLYFIRACMKFSQKMDILMNAVQKQMRRDLTNDYHKYMAEGKIDDDDLDAWIEGYDAYHALGQNGVMDSRRDDLIRLNSKNGKSE